MSPVKKMATVHGSQNGTRKGLEEGSGMVLLPDRLTGSTRATEEHEEFPGGRLSNSIVAANRNRSRSGDRRPHSSIRPGTFRAFLVTAAVSILLIPLLTRRFIACFEASMLHKATSRGASAGVVSRTLAAGQENKPSLVSASQGASAGPPPRPIWVPRDSIKSSLAAARECHERLADQLADYDPEGVIINVDHTSRREADDFAGHPITFAGWAREVLQMWKNPSPLQIFLTVAFAVTVAGLLTALIGYKTPGDTAPIHTASYVLASLSLIMFFSAGLGYGIQKLMKHFRSGRRGAIARVLSQGWRETVATGYTGGRGTGPQTSV